MKNLAHWKTSAIGIVSLASGFSYVFLSEDPDYVILSILLCLGLLLLFSPDSILLSLRRGAKNLSRGVFNKSEDGGSSY